MELGTSWSLLFGILVLDVIRAIWVSVPSSQWKVDRLKIRIADLSHGAFTALTGGHLDPPGQFDISW